MVGGIFTWEIMGMVDLHGIKITDFLHKYYKIQLGSLNFTVDTNPVQTGL